MIIKVIQYSKESLPYTLEEVVQRNPQSSFLFRKQQAQSEAQEGD